MCEEQAPPLRAEAELSQANTLGLAPDQRSVLALSIGSIADEIVSNPLVYASSPLGFFHFCWVQSGC